MQFPDLPEARPSDAVSFQLEDVDLVLPPQPLLETWLRDLAAAEKRSIEELTYIFCSDDYLHEINLKYLEHDDYTDVITFPYSLSSIHGDVFISVDRVRENSLTLGLAFEDELCRVMAHGLLHLCGYGDKTPDEAANMRAREEYCLQMRKF